MKSVLAALAAMIVLAATPASAMSFSSNARDILSDAELAQMLIEQPSGGYYQLWWHRSRVQHGSVDNDFYELCMAAHGLHPASGSSTYGVEECVRRQQENNPWVYDFGQFDLSDAYCVSLSSQELSNLVHRMTVQVEAVSTGDSAQFQQLRDRLEEHSASIASLTLLVQQLQATAVLHTETLQELAKAREGDAGSPELVQELEEAVEALAEFKAKLEEERSLRSQEAVELSGTGVQQEDLAALQKRVEELESRREDFSEELETIGGQQERTITLIEELQRSVQEEHRPALSPPELPRLQPQDENGAIQDDFWGLLAEWWPTLVIGFLTIVILFLLFGKGKLRRRKSSSAHQPQQPPPSTPSAAPAAPQSPSAPAAQPPVAGLRIEFSPTASPYTEAKVIDANGVRDTLKLEKVGESTASGKTNGEPIYRTPYAPRVGERNLEDHIKDQWKKSHP